MVQSLWRTVWLFLTKLNILSPYKPAIVFIGINPNKLKSYIPSKICTRMFIAAVRVITKTY